MPQSNAVRPIQNVSVSPRQEGGGLLVHRLISLATNNATVIKANASQLYGWYFTNVGDVPVFLKIYDKATTPDPATDTPILTLAIPGDPSGGGANQEMTNGIAFEDGLSFLLVANVADTDDTAVAADEVVLNLLYL